VSDAPLKVSRETKEKVRLGAAMMACTQGEFVDQAVAEFLESHKEELSVRVDGARHALLGNKVDVIGYLLEVDPDEIRRISS
jgi:hypothetical protein